MSLDEKGEISDHSDSAGIIWNGGHNSRFFSKSKGLTLEVRKISAKEADELGDICIVKTNFVVKS